MLIEELKYFMIISGTWNIDWTENPCLKTFQLWYRRSIQGFAFIYVVLSFAKLIQLIMIGADVKVIYSCASESLSGLGIGIKALIYETTNISRLFQEIKNEEGQISISLDDKVIKSYTKDAKVCINLKNAFVKFIIVAVFAFFSSRSKNFMNSKELGQKSEKEWIETYLIFPLWLPYKECDHVIATIIINIPIAFACGSLYVANQVILITLLTFAAANLKILQILIQNLKSTNDNNIKNYSALSKIAKKHFSIISFVNKLNDCLRYFMLTEFLLYSINIALVATEISMEQNLKEFTCSVMHLMGLVPIVYLQGWFANEIQVQNLAIGEALYQTKWYNQDVKTQKLLQGMICQTQQLLSVSISRFGPMTLATALKIMQAAYSYVALMRNFR